MKINLGIGEIDLPESYGITSFIANGPRDTALPLTAGMPTAAKTQQYEHDRVMAISLQDAGGQEITMDALKAGLGEIKDRARSKLANLKEHDGTPPKITAELHHRLEKMPLVTFVCLTAMKGKVCSMMLTSLDDKKTIVGARKDFDAIVAGLKSA